MSNEIRKIEPIDENEDAIEEMWEFIDEYVFIHWGINVHQKDTEFLNDLINAAFKQIRNERNE